MFKRGKEKKLAFSSLGECLLSWTLSEHLLAFILDFVLCRRHYFLKAILSNLTRFKSPRKQTMELSMRSFQGFNGGRKVGPPSELGAQARWLSQPRCLLPSLTPEFNRWDPLVGENWLLRVVLWPPPHLYDSMSVHTLKTNLRRKQLNTPVFITLCLLTIGTMWLAASHFFLHAFPI